MLHSMADPSTPGPDHHRSADTRQEWPHSRVYRGRDDSLLQLETRLKAVDRYFNLRNHPARSDGPVGLHHDLSHELEVIDEQLHRLIRLVDRMLDGSGTESLAFRHYLEVQWLSDDRRDSILRQHRDQDRPEESLYSLLVGLRSLAQLTADARAIGQVHLPSFRAFADQYRSLIVHNRFFGPLANHPLYPTAGWTTHPAVQGSIRLASSQRLRRSLGFTILILGRYLTILNWINPLKTDRAEVIGTIPLLALLRSEFRSLRVYLERSLRGRFFPDGTRTEAEREVLSCVDSMAFQLAAEEERAFDTFLRDYHKSTNLFEMASRVEAVKQLLTVFFEGATLALLKIVSSHVVPEEIFPDMAIRLEQSARLREDLWIFAEVLGHVVLSISDPDSDLEERRRMYRRLLDFLTYFETLSFEGIRFTEYDSFVSFFTEMRELRDEPFDDQARNQDIVSNFECFRIFIEMVRGHVSQRAELQGTSLDTDHARNVLDQFLSR